MEQLTQIRRFIEKNELTSALNELSLLMEGSKNQDDNHQLILLRSQWNELTVNRLNKLIDESTYAVDFQKLKKAILDLALILVEGEEAFPEERRSWDRLLSKCNNFQKGHYYIYIIDAENLEPLGLWRHLHRIPLHLVIDFDEYTDESGAFFHCKPYLEAVRSLHLWTHDMDYSQMNLDKASYWFAANGLAGREATKVTSEKEWGRKYGEGALPKLIQAFAANARGRLINVLIMSKQTGRVDNICSKIDAALPDRVKFVFLSQPTFALADKHLGETYDLPINSFLEGIPRYFSEISEDNQLDYGLPQKDGGMSYVMGPKLRWLEEDMEVLHSSILKVASETEDQDFYRGSTISWHELDGRKDIDRDKTQELEPLLREELRLRTTVRINLYHEPGGGGTTLARRLAWIFKPDYPVVLLKRCNADTFSRIRELFQLTKQTLLVVVYSSDIIREGVDGLYEEIKSNSIPCVFLFVARWHQSEEQNQPGSRSKRSFFVSGVLSTGEANHFLERYVGLKPERRDELKQIAAGELRLKTPFMFALTAFGRDFKGIHSYVQTRLQGATPKQQGLMTFISLAYYFGHQPIIDQYFVHFLELPESSYETLNLATVLSERQLDLFLEEDRGYWRPIHQAIALEVITQVLAGDGPHNQWFNELANWTCMFIELGAPVPNETPNDELQELLSRLFVERDETSYREEGNAQLFAELIEKIPVDEGKERVFAELVYRYPKEAHFRAHYGRFLSRIMKKQKQGIEQIQIARQLDPDDQVLAHIEGTIWQRYGSEILQEMIALKRNGQDPIIRFHDLENAIDKSATAYELARSLGHKDEHPYISEIRMYLNCIDRLFKISSFGERAHEKGIKLEFLQSGTQTGAWSRQLLDRAQILYANLQLLKEGNHPSSYATSVKNEMHEIYSCSEEDYEKVIHNWQQLLTMPDVHQPTIRRQLVYTYLNAKEREWSQLSTKRLQDIQQLMEDNMLQEPNKDSNIRMWFRAVRYLKSGDLNRVLEKLVTWSHVGDTIDGHFYLYILYFLKAIDEGDSLAAAKAGNSIERCREKAKFVNFRNNSLEWMGPGLGVGHLVHHKELDWPEHTEFVKNTEILVRLNGRIAQIRDLSKGEIEIAGTGLKAFFVPSRAEGLTGSKADINTKVDFYLGFSYDGLRAWQVKAMD